MNEQAKDQQPASIMSWKEFLQSFPPGKSIIVSDVASARRTMSGVYYDVGHPIIRLHCPEESCATVNYFECTQGIQPGIPHEKWHNGYLVYVCRNCKKYTKRFAIAVKPLNEVQCETFKFGEFPSFGAPVPARVLRMFQRDKDLFLAGKKSEDLGLGIGAFAYYRRVVFDMWGEIVDEIVRVAEATRMTPEAIEGIRQLREETQFSKAVKLLKEGIPPSLLIDGANPLILLHDALSDGLHNLSDEECLKRSVAVHTVLVDLADNIGQALKDKRVTIEAVKSLKQMTDGRFEKK